MVICADEWGVDEFIDAAAVKGVHVRVGQYRHEREKVITRGKDRRMLAPDYPTILDLKRVSPPGEFAEGPVVQASTDAFAQTWDALSAPMDTKNPYVSAVGHVPEDWLPFLPFPSLNPAQMETLDAVMGDGSVMVVAPTGAGKTMVGMLAALKEIKGRGGKAAWLVPQRSLTVELDRELDSWRKQGLKVVALSGEASTDMRRTREADLWVATTEKFEALCRSTSMRQTIEEIGTLVVDEIHLLGEPNRGPMLETLLARIKSEESSVRLVGLSATAANAPEVAQWLGSELVEIAWRPTRLTQQILTIPMGDRAQEGRHRNHLCSAIVDEVSLDGGSTLVFCGTKANVRSAALSIASSRGVETSGIDQTDVEAVAQACDSAGVGLHYSDWPYKHASEKAFRERKTNVLVATSTLAAGVNTPARVVVIRDTSIGPQPMEVSMIQQMFGRAGRAGKEVEGWSLLICSSNEVGRWRQRLSDGYTIRSGLLDGMVDHLLGEIVQGRIKTLREMESWWVSTLAYHQGAREVAALHRAKTFLETWKFIEVAEIANADQSIKATQLGAITSKMMVPVQDAANIVGRLTRTPMPGNHASAEMGVIEMLSTEVGSLSNSPDAPQDQTFALMRILAAQGDVRSMGNSAPPRGGARSRVAGSDVVKAGLLLCARSPQAMASRGRQIAGVNRALFAPALYDTPRYLAWLAALGSMGLAPAWASVVAADLGARVTHHRLAPTRGSGRLLRMCEQVVGQGGESRMAALWDQVKASGASTPSDWPFSQAPTGASMEPQDYATMIASKVSLSARGGKVSASAGSSAYQSANGQWRRVGAKSGGSPDGALVAAFGARGDWAATGWLESFCRVSPS